MPYEVDEVGRITRRIEKAKRRVERNYQAPPGKETEQHRIERLEKRLAQIKTPPLEAFDPHNTTVPEGWKA